MNEGYWILLLIVAGVSFWAGRWNGILEFDRQMVEAGLLPKKKTQ